MKEERLLTLIGELPDPFLQEAERTRGGRIRRRLLTVAAAAAALAALLGTALAVSPELRKEVFAFFHIATPAAVLPDTALSEPDGPVSSVGEQTVEDAARVEYVRIEGEFGRQGAFSREHGVIIRYLNGPDGPYAAFSTVENGEVAELPASRVETSCVWDGETVPIMADWCVQDGELVIVGFGRSAPGSPVTWTVSALPGRTDAALLRLNRPGVTRLMLLYPAEGRVADVFAGTEADGLTDVVGWDFSPDLRRALLTTGHGEESWYCDLENGTCVRDCEVAGREAFGGWFVDADTLLFQSQDAEHRWTYWTVTLSTGERTELFRDLPMVGDGQRWGLRPAGRRYGLLVEQDGAVAVLDYLTGQRAPVEGFTDPGEGLRLQPNSREDRLLLTQNTAYPEGTAFTQLGVLDLTAHTFTLLDRADVDLREEHTVSWFDSDRVAVSATGADGAQYLYLYRLGR